MPVETPDVVQLGSRGLPGQLVRAMLVDIDVVNQRLVDAILADNRGYLDAARANGGIDPSILLDVATSVWTVVDAVSSEMAKAYRDTELDLARQDDQRRNALIDDLLQGRGPDRGFAQEAGQTLGLPADS